VWKELYCIVFLIRSFFEEVALPACHVHGGATVNISVNVKKHLDQLLTEDPTKRILAQGNISGVANLT